MTLDTAVLDVDRVELLISVVPDTEESRLLTALRTKIRAQLEAKQKEDARNSWAMSKASANSSKRPGDADVDAAALAGDAAEEDFSGVRIAERYMLRLLSVPRVQQKLSLFELHYRGDRTAEEQLVSVNDSCGDKQEGARTGSRCVRMTYTASLSNHTQD